MASSSVHRHRPHIPDENSDAFRRQNPVGPDNHIKENPSNHILSKGIPLDRILDRCRVPPQVKDMASVKDANTQFMILPFKYDPSFRNRAPQAKYDGKDYVDRWDENHVHMPCSPKFVDRSKQPMWAQICAWLRNLRDKCDNKRATVDDLKATIEKCAGRHYELDSLETLIEKVFLAPERNYFMSAVLSNICSAAIYVDKICSTSPPLLRSGKSQSVTMSQQQAFSLLACAFFCLFPERSESDQAKGFENYQNPNFNRLYKSGSSEKIEKLRCILFYFQRVMEDSPCGVISFRRCVLSDNDTPMWTTSKENICDVHIMTDTKIEDVECTLQVDFANKYIGGGVLGNGCVQEEIRFSICPEMLVSLLLCEGMEANECIHLIGCERFSNYDGYAGSFKFIGGHKDKTPKDNWGRKWCHLVAIDAICFRDRTAQYEMKSVSRELKKAFIGFRPRATQTGAENLFGITTGHWGCGAFNGDKQLKAIIQLAAASEAQRPLVYAAYRDQNFVDSFGEVYESLKRQKATVSDLYRYLELYSTRHTSGSLFEFILRNPIPRPKPK